MWAATISVTVVAQNYRETSLTPLYAGSNAHGGWLFIRHTHQTVAELLLPPPPLLFAVLIMRWEIPWARVFPLRSVGSKLRQPSLADVANVIICKIIIPNIIIRLISRLMLRLGLSLWQGVP